MSEATRTCCCATCGLLALEDPRTRATVECVPEWREKGLWTGIDHRQRPAQVFCAAGSHAFPGPPLIESAEEALEIINTPIECQDWQPYRRGHSPIDCDINRMLITIGRAALEKLGPPGPEVVDVVVPRLDWAPVRKENL